MGAGHVHPPHRAGRPGTSPSTAEAQDRAGYLLTRTLDSLGPTSVNDLATEVGTFDASTVTRQLGALERRGFVERTVDPADRRSRILQLTPLGRRTMQAVRTTRHERIDALVSDWADADIEALGRLMTRLNHNLTD